MLFITRNGDLVRSNNRFSGDHPKNYRRDRHEAQAQRAKTVRRVEDMLAATAIAEALEDHEVDENVGDVGPGIDLIHDRRTGRLLAACVG